MFAHRGASGDRPEHTRAAYEVAIAQGADGLELDVVATRDGVLVCRHEHEIGGTTDVAERAEFADRRTTRTVPGRAEATGWFVEDSAFPSDSYAVRSQVALHGFDPDESVIRLRPRPGEDTLRTADVLAVLDAEGDRIALLMLGGVNYLTGELVDIPAITAAGRRAGAVVGWDLAHAVGNVPLALSEWDVDWAAWCHYKYVNSGPGAVAGAFVHRRHLADRTLPKLQGWWSTNEATRFAMGPVVDPVDTADAWQLSNPPILAMAPVLASLQIFDEVGMVALRERSVRLTGYLEALLDGMAAGSPLRLLTPRDPRRRGAQLSVRIGAGTAQGVCERLRREHGVIADAREPDVVRLAPAPLYCTHHDAWRAAKALVTVVGG